MSKKLAAEHRHEPPKPFKKCKSEILETLVIDIDYERLTFEKIVPEWRDLWEIYSYPLSYIRDQSFQVLNQNNHIFFISQYSKAIYSLDINNNMGHFKKLLECQSIGGTGAILHGLLYIICGRDCNENTTELIECYDLQATTRLSKHIPKMHYLRNGIGLVAHEAAGCLFVVGGRNVETNQVVSKVQAYSAAENTWTQC